MKLYRYFILMESAPPQHVNRQSDLQALLDQGWLPVRETPMGGGLVRGDHPVDLTIYAFASLILLEKEGEA